ncbi:MAG TPA: ABC transporter substrate-binding protein [Acidimicrobiales bacterium]
MRTSMVSSWRPRSFTAVALVAALLTATAACGGGGSDDDASPGDGGGEGSIPDCPLDALDEATGPVEITMWHTMGRANEEALVSLTDAFNASQEKVRVKLVNNTSYDDQQDKYRAGLSTGDLPDVALMQDVYQQQMVDTQTVLPAQSCMEEDTGFDEGDFVPRTLEYYRIGSVQWGLPFNVSNPVLYYDKAAFRQAGLDPEAPPVSFDDVRAAAQAVKDAGFPTGMSLKVDSWHFEQFLALQDGELVDNGNGREERATAAAFDSDEGREVFAFLGGLVADGLATPSPRTGPSQFDNILGIGSHNHAMTIDSSAALGTITEVLGSGQYADVELGVAPLPGRTADGGVTVGGAALYISADEPEKQAAAWEYIAYLTSPETQSKWAAATGYIPVRTSAVDLPEVTARWEEIPGFRVAYDQLVEGADTTATGGAVIGDFESVRAAIEEALNRMYLEDGDPAAALTEAADAATAAIESYNERL